MYYRIEQMSKCIDVGGSQGPVPAWDNHQQPQSKDSSPEPGTSYDLHGNQDTW